MAGGRGERFWPESRTARPKQLLPIVGEKAMLAQTIDRLADLVPAEDVFVITNMEQRDSVLEVCPQLDPAKVIGEPVGRDTAAAVGLATVLVRREDPEAVFAMLPADAVIHDAAGLCATLESAFAAAEADPVLATIGITASFPATGYGYIQQGTTRGDYAGRAVYHVKRFVEKPELATAQSYLDAGDYFWNAGMFIWSVSAIVAELEKSTPTLWQALQAIDQGLEAGQGIDAVLSQHYPKLEKISVDYAIIEKADKVVMVESGFDWDLIVVRTEDATLVCHKDKAQEIKDLVKKIGTKASYKHLI
jgi:mannose-1-phosphate guanylyltransferase